VTFSDHVLKIELQGYSVLPDLLTQEECAAARSELAQIIDFERELPGARHDPSSSWAYNLMNKARVFERVYQVPELLRVIRHFLGQDAVISGVMGRVVYPGAPAQGLHFDGSITGPFRSDAAADRERRNIETVFGLNVIWCLSPFRADNGPTRLVPGSHRLPTREIPREAAPPGELAIEAEAGSVLLFNIATWHGASAHQGAEPRYSLITPWRRSWVRPEADLSRMVAPEVLDRAGPEGRTIFGFASRPTYIERWMWDGSQGRPRPEFRHLERDEPLEPVSPCRS
jgi:ectoine hydroxylase-related dioxygenase (phytanoyl-CoA dioxygenase family)